MRRYADAGDYTDCFQTIAAGDVRQADYVRAFYTTPLFRTERWILAWAMKKPSSDDEARQLAGGEREEFSAWQVEERRANQLLMMDFKGRTRSWLMTEPAPAQYPSGTRLYFGSAVIRDVGAAESRQARLFNSSLMLRFHVLYSILLLAAARHRLEHSR